MNFSPKYFPPSDVSKASAIILSLKDQHIQNEFSFSCLQSVWIDEKDIGDEKIEELIIFIKNIRD